MASPPRVAGSARESHNPLGRRRLSGRATAGGGGHARLRSRASKTSKIAHAITKTRNGDRLVHRGSRTISALRPRAITPYRTPRRQVNRPLPGNLFCHAFAVTARRRSSRGAKPAARPQASWPPSRVNRFDSRWRRPNRDALAEETADAYPTQPHQGSQVTRGRWLRLGR
jgi:hypothetical protein